MRLLVLGGTVFLSRAVAAEAVRRGHEVTCAAAGRPARCPTARACVEVGPHRSRCRTSARSTPSSTWPATRPGSGPRWRRTPDAHWVFVSTVNVYADDATPGGTPATLPLVEAIDEDVDLKEDPEAYGPMKVACEQDRARRRRLRDGDPARADRRTGGPDRSVHLLAAAARGRR